MPIICKIIISNENRPYSWDFSIYAECLHDYYKLTKNQHEICITMNIRFNYTDGQWCAVNVAHRTKCQCQQLNEFILQMKWNGTKNDAPIAMAAVWKRGRFDLVCEAN